ncbi:MAG: hypothetical protein NC200_06480 [Candidatus Gastranaerophilales bacterium]|nr:hypothetical protein [Candidatus Gastranaerophilales bacterium]
MEINNSKPVKSVAFQGYQHKKTETGSQSYVFNCPYDTKKYTCEVQIFKVGVDKKNNYFIRRGCDNKMEPFFKADIPEGGLAVEPDFDLHLKEDQPFAYRYALKDKKGNFVKFVEEDNNTIDGCTLVSRNGTTPMKQGPMYLAIADSFAPGYVYAGFHDKDTGKIIEPDDAKKAEIAEMIRNSSRSFSNTMGGTLAGLEAKVPELRAAGFKRIITCPLKGGDNASSHKYWNENNMVIAGGLGNINNYDSLQREAFKHGMNLVDDGTFTSEGLQGIHYQRAIKWMDTDNKPAEYYYFRMSGLQDDSLGLGVVPANYENMRPKLVNCPFDVVVGKDGQYSFPKNKEYDPKQPTYFQIYDDSLVSEKQRKSKTKVISSYENTTNYNKLSMNTHDDTPIPYAFEVQDSNELKKNLQSLNEVNKMRDKDERIAFNSPRGAMFVGSLSGIRIEPKEEGGFVCWDSNTDMVKLNYFTSNYDNEMMASEKNPAKIAIEMDKYRRANAQVQDMTMSAGKYWTKHVRNVHNEYVAKTIGEISDKPGKAYNRIEGILNSQNPASPKLPEDVRLSKDIITNILDDNYELRPKYEDYDDLMNSSLMDLPLDSIEFANDTAAALSSPYLSKRSSDVDHIGQSRFDAMNDKTYKVPKEYAKVYNKMNDTFTGEIRDFANKVMQDVDRNSKEKLFEDGEVTEYGQYVIPLVAEDIAKYAIVKAMMPEVGAKQLKNGEIAYDYDTMREQGTLRNLGINGDSQEDEANQIATKIRNGVKNLKNSDIKFVASSINKRINNTNTNSFKLAEVMVDRSGLGLDWRLDAAKDVADMDAVRNGAQRFDKGWDNVVKFWSNFVQSVKAENPNSYIVAELTDVGDVHKIGAPDDGDEKYNSADAVSKLLSVAGITSEANYGNFFNGIPNLFSYDFASGSDKVDNKNEERIKQLENALSAFASMPIDYKRNAYTFAGNHDKPRMIHCLSMDMSLFHADLSNIDDKNHRKEAFKIMNDKMKDTDLSGDDWNIINHDKNYFNNVSSKAVANGALLRGSIGSANQTLRDAEHAEVNNSNISNDEKENKNKEIDEKYNAIYTALSKSIADVVNGNYYKTKHEEHGLSTPDSYKKVGEKDGFGSKAIPDAFDIVYDHAVQKYGLSDKLTNDKLQQYRNTVDDEATKVGRTKTKIIMKYLYAISGNPTLYSGDELGMTGYEDKCKNTYLQNRNPLDWSIVEGKDSEKRQTIVDFRNDLFEMSKARADVDMNNMEALNNGTMYKLDRQNGNGGDASAILSQAANGAMNISVFNPNGISTTPTVNDLNDIRPNDITLDSIYLKTAKGKLSLKVGTTFRNADTADKSLYIVCQNNDDYYIKRFDADYKFDENKKDDKMGKNGQNIVLNASTASDGVMMLYHVPDDVKAERTEAINKKTRVREYFNHKYNIPNESTYTENSKETKETGKNVDITSK